MNEEPIYIILADDDETDRMVFKMALQGLKVKTKLDTVNDGETLMDHLTKKNAILPKLIFLDLNMPVKNGIACLKEIKTIERLKNILIAIYSTSSSEKDKTETFLNGANVYIKKPEDFNELKEILEKVVLTTSIYQDPPFNKANFILNI